MQNDLILGEISINCINYHPVLPSSSIPTLLVIIYNNSHGVNILRMNIESYNIVAILLSRYLVQNIVIFVFLYFAQPYYWCHFFDTQTLAGIHPNKKQPLHMWKWHTACYPRGACTEMMKSKPRFDALAERRWKRLKEAALQRGTKCYMHGYHEGVERAWRFRLSSHAERR